MNTFNDDNELGLFEEPPRRPPRDRGRGPQRSGQRRPNPRQPGPPAGSNATTLRLAGLVALGIVVVVGFVLWVGSCSGSSQQSYASYLSAMQPLAQDSAKVGKDFATALSTSGLTLESFKSDLASWSAQEKVDYLAAQRLRPPGPLQSVHAEALATFQLRYLSLDHLAATLTTLQQSKHVSASIAGAALASDAALLSTSDVVWEQLYMLQATTVLTAQGVVTGVKVPASKIVTSADIVSANSLRTVYQRVTTSSTGGNVTGIHGSNLIGANAVENGVSKQLSTSTTTTVGSSAEIDVVFANSGDYLEGPIPVTLTIHVSGKSYTATVTVSEIAVGGQATASFTNLQVPTSAFGASASISVNIGRVPGEARLDNNQATYPVLFQLSPS